MSLTMAKSEGVTVLTLATDPQSPCPPLCQILKEICYSPVCCSMSQHLRTVQGLSQSVLGTIHIMVGLLNNGLGAVLLVKFSYTWRTHPFWLGAMFLLFGIVSILSERFPSLCLVILNVILSLAGVVSAIVAIVIHSISTRNTWLHWSCYEYGSRYIPPPSYNLTAVYKNHMREKCDEGRDLTLMLLKGMGAVLIVLSVLELCITISSVVLGIKAVKSSMKTENKGTGDPKHIEERLEEVTTNSTA